jgi:hypothetical protein
MNVLKSPFIGGAIVGREVVISPVILEGGYNYCFV